MLKGASAFFGVIFWFAYYWYVSLIKITFVSNYRLNFFHQRLNWKLYTFWSGQKTNIIDLCIKIRIVRICPKIVFKLVSSRLLKWCFSVNTGLISLMRVTIQNIQLIYQIQLIFKSAGSLHQNRDRPKNSKMFLLMSKLKLTVLCNYQPNLFQQVLQWRF